jgi:hypothetical protein
MDQSPFALEFDRHVFLKARQHAARLEGGQDFFAPKPAVRNCLKDLGDKTLVKAVTCRGADGYGALLEQLQAHGVYWKDTKVAYANALALAIWELCRRAFGIVPTFGEIGAIAASAGFQPPKTDWSVPQVVEQFAKGLRSYCATTCERGLATLGGDLALGEQVGVAAILEGVDDRQS